MEITTVSQNYLKKYRQIIWDWNGTLLDDVWLCVEVMNEMLAKRNLHEITIEKYRGIFDFPVRTYYQNIGFDFKNEPFEKVGNDFIIRYNRRQYECNLQAGAEDVLKYFKKQGIQQSVLSAREHDTLIQNLNFFRLREYFDQISGLGDIYANGKNQTGKQLINDLRSDNSGILFIGDTLHDIEVAEENGIDCILIGHGHQSQERLINKGYPVFDTLTDFYQILTHNIIE